VTGSFIEKLLSIAEFRSSGQLLLHPAPLGSACGIVSHLDQQFLISFTIL
jgi:hypothetical protein